MLLGEIHWSYEILRPLNCEVTNPSSETTGIELCFKVIEEDVDWSLKRDEAVINAIFLFLVGMKKKSYLILFCTSESWVDITYRYGQGSYNYNYNIPLSQMISCLIDN